MACAVAAVCGAAAAGMSLKVLQRKRAGDHGLRFKPMAVPSDHSLQLRQLKPDDHARGFFDVLSELTNAAPVPQATFTERYWQQRKVGQYCVVVIVDSQADRVIGTATLLVEQKFLRGCGSVGHIEDVVVSKAYRGRKLGQLLLRELTDLAFQVGCYKVILDCDADKAGFYQSCGFRIKGVQMAKYF